jgi:hypothetical protein
MNNRIHEISHKIANKVDEILKQLNIVGKNNSE